MFTLHAYLRVYLHDYLHVYLHDYLHVNAYASLSQEKSDMLMKTRAVRKGVACEVTAIGIVLCAQNMICYDCR